MESTANKNDVNHEHAAGDPSRELAKQLFRAPMLLYQLGWGPVLNWLPLLILTTKGRNTGLPRHVVIEYRRHGSKYYVVSSRGGDTDWFRNIQASPRVAIQHGDQIFAARAKRVEDPAEALRALYMFSRNSWIYETLFARMASAQAADLNTLAEVADEFTVVRFEPSGHTQELPPVELFSEPVRRAALVVAFLLLARFLMVLLRRR